MPSLHVVISTVADGSMYNREDKFDPSVYQNRITLLDSIGLTASDATRIRVGYDRSDFTETHVISEQHKSQGILDENVIISDALVTTGINHALLLPIADCVGAAIYDPEHQVLMVAHWGRHSLEQQGAERCIQFFKETYKSDVSKLEIHLTPAPAKEHYQIWKLDNKGMKEATFEQLARAGIHKDQIIDHPEDTFTDPRYYSYSAYLQGKKENDGDYVIVAVIKP